MHYPGGALAGQDVLSAPAVNAGLVISLMVVLL